MAAAVIAAIPVVIKLLVAFLVVISLAYNLYSESRTIKLIWREGNVWSMQLSPSTAPDAAELCRVDFLSTWLVVITLKPKVAKRRRRFVIPFDSVSKDSYRLFRVRLRIEGHHLINPTNTD